MNQEILEIAELIRGVFEKIAKEENRSNNLQGFCGRAAVQFCLEAEERGISADLVLGAGHAYSFVEGIGIVDVTATQFNGFAGTEKVGYGRIEIKNSDALDHEWWYFEEFRWPSVQDWLENWQLSDDEDSEDLFDARSKMWNDRERVLNAKRGSFSAVMAVGAG
jgi:hypothetical protein